MGCSRTYFLFGFLIALVFFVLPLIGILIEAFSDWGAADIIPLLLILLCISVVIVGVVLYGPCKKFFKKAPDPEAPSAEINYGMDSYNFNSDSGGSNSQVDMNTSGMPISSIENEATTTEIAVDYVYSFTNDDDGNINEGFDSDGEDFEERRRREVVELEEHVTKLLLEVQLYSEYLSDSLSDIVVSEQCKLVAWIEEQAVPSDQDINTLKAALSPIAAKVNRLKSYRFHRSRPSRENQAQDVYTIGITSNVEQDESDVPSQYIPPPAYADIFPEQTEAASTNSDAPEPATHRQSSTQERPESPPAYEEAIEN